MRNVILSILFLLLLSGFPLLASSAAPAIPFSPDTPGYNSYKQNLSYTHSPESVRVLPVKYSRESLRGLLVPVDNSFTVSLAGLDDSFSEPITLPFSFDLYGTPQTQFYINNNGNISFGNPYSTFTPQEFPIIEFPMLAPFWADVDTRGALSGSVYYRVDAHRVIVTWSQVGYYDSHDDKLNAFQVVFSDGTDSQVGLGRNVAFSYGDMQWTTGDASGGINGFGGTAALAGINLGDGISFDLVGRFDHAGMDYSGPGGNGSGVSYLDNQVFYFNTSPAALQAPVFGDLPEGAVILMQGSNTTVNILASSPQGYNTVDAIITSTLPAGLTYNIIPGNPCQIELQIEALTANLGNHTIQVTATDDNNPSLSSQINIPVRIYANSEYVMVVNRSTASLSVIDTATNALFGPFLQGQLGSGQLLDIVVSPDNQFALVSNFADYKVFHLDISNPLNPTLITSYDLGFAAEDITLSYDGRFALVADGGNQTVISVIDLQSRTTVQTLNISPRFAQGIELGIDGKVLINDAASGALYQYQLDQQSGVLTDTGVSLTNQGAVINTAIHPSGMYAVESSYNSYTRVLRLNEDNTITAIQILPVNSQTAVYSADGKRLALGVIGTSPDQLRLYSVLDDGTLNLLETYDSDTYSTGGYYGVDGIAINSANDRLYLSNVLSSTETNTVKTVDVSTGTVSTMASITPAGLYICNRPLKSYFNYNLHTGTFGTQIEFRQFSTGAPTSYLWNFGDGITSTLLNPHHTYTDSGVFSVTLTVSRDGQTQSSTQLIQMTSDPEIHLTLAGSPYTLTDDFVVGSSQTLFIEPGVTLSFGSNAGLKVHGRIVANNATFTGNEGSGWKGLEIESSAPDNVLNNCTILHAIKALTLINTTMPVNNLSISKTNVFPGEAGLTLIQASNATLSGLDIANYAPAIVIQNEQTRVTSTPVITNVRVRNSGSSIRTDSKGITVNGSVALSLSNAVIEEYDTGLEYIGANIEYTRTTPVITNVRVRNSSSSIRSIGTGMVLRGLERVIVDQDSIGGYPTGLSFEYTSETRATSTPVITNVRVRNSGSSIRTDSKGITVSGAVALTLDNAEIDDYDFGVEYLGSGTIDMRTTPVITNVRVRNSSSSIRSAGTGIVLSGLERVIVDSDSIDGYPNGLSFAYTSTNRTLSTPVITNVRVRNTGSSIRTAGKGIEITGAVVASIDSVNIDAVGTGISYTGNGQTLTTTTPTITNVRIRNSSSSIREDAIGISLNNLAGVTLGSNVISVVPTEAGMREVVTGNGIQLNGVQNAQIQNNTIWGFSTGLDATLAGNTEFSDNMLWADTPTGLQQPIRGNVIVHNSNISYAAGTYPGTGNYNLDPLFVNPVEGDFHLKFRSPFRDLLLGAIPFSFDYLAATRTYTMHRGWNLMGVPYTPRSGQNTPVTIFADDLNPFYVSPYYTSIVQYNQISPTATLGHMSLTNTGSYNTPAYVYPPMGYWVNNTNNSTTIDIYGLMDDGNWMLDVPGQAGTNNGWYMLANPYDLPISFGNGLATEGMVMPAVYSYSYAQNSYNMITPDNGGTIPPWSGFFLKANSATDKVHLSYPVSSRLGIISPLAAENGENLPTSNPAAGDWEIALIAGNDLHKDSIVLGAAHNASDSFDGMDVPELPIAPFVLNTPFDLTVMNNNWNASPGKYTRDIKSLEANSWTWDVSLDISSLPTEDKVHGLIQIALQDLHQLPANYGLSLTDLSTGISVDPRVDNLELNVCEAPHGGLSSLNAPAKLRFLQFTVTSPAGGVLPRGQNIMSAGNYPNPFNPQTFISYNLASESNVKLDIYNLKGQKVCTLVDGKNKPGNHRVPWNGIDQLGKPVSSGIYFFRLQAGAEVVTQKLLISK